MANGYANAAANGTSSANGGALHEQGKVTAGKLPNGHEALDLAETVSLSFLALHFDAQSVHTGTARGGLAGSGPRKRRVRANDEGFE